MSAHVPPRPNGKLNAFERYHHKALASVVSRFSANTTEQVGNPAALMSVRARAVADIAAYKDWLNHNYQPKPRNKFQLTPTKLRQGVIMMRSGSSVTDVAEAWGASCSTASKWLSALPEKLRSMIAVLIILTSAYAAYLLALLAVTTALPAPVDDSIHAAPLIPSVKQD